MQTRTIANLISETKTKTKSNNIVYQPVILDIKQKEHQDIFYRLLEENEGIQVFDEIKSQIIELIKCQNPTIGLMPPSVLEEALINKLKNQVLEEYGVWVYYPWSNKIIHLLDEDEFKIVRTNRNKYKITEAEQQQLATKRIGVIGLSVGQSVSLTLAMERGFGELRIADFDELDLSNLNRIRTGVHNLKHKKSVVVAREIAELDPFLNVICYHNGVNDENINDFLTANGKLDLLIDECDSFDVKINVRKLAKSLQIPVLMEGSDRCTIDIERFDLEPNRPVLHGMVDHLDMEKYKDLKSFDDKIPYITSVVGVDTLSPRMKASAIELMSTISTWPQLASSVTYGGGVTADLSRKILLNHISISGRYFLDLDEFFSPNNENKPTNTSLSNSESKPLDSVSISNFINQNKEKFSLFSKGIHLTDEQLLAMIEAAKWAPSGGNNQPWHWHYVDKKLHLFMDEQEAQAYLDPDFLSSYQSIGAAIENILLAAAKLGLKTNWQLTPAFAPLHLAVFSFENGHQAKEEELILAKYIPLRHTNRKSPQRTEISDNDLLQLQELIEETPGTALKFTSDLKDFKDLAEIATFTDLLRMFIPEAHEDFLVKEMRWTPEQALEQENGIGIHTLDLSNNDSIGIRLLQDRRMIDFLQEIKGGSGFGRLLHQQYLSASAFGLITIPDYSVESLINCGIASEKMWLKAKAMGWQLHPLNVPLLFFYKNSVQNVLTLDTEKQDYLMKAEKQLNRIFNNSEKPIFMFRIFKASDSPERTIRKSNHKILSIGRAN